MIANNNGTYADPLISKYWGSREEILQKVFCPAQRSHTLMLVGFNPWLSGNEALTLPVWSSCFQHIADDKFWSHLRHLSHVHTSWWYSLFLSKIASKWGKYPWHVHLTDCILATSSPMGNPASIPSVLKCPYVSNHYHLFSNLDFFDWLPVKQKNFTYTTNQNVTFKYKRWFIREHLNLDT